MKLLRSPKLPSNGLQFAIVALLGLGIFFRFTHLDQKVYWHDEVYTSLRISGYPQAELVQQVFDGRVIGIEDLQKYQRPDPAKGLKGTVHSLANDVPQHPPLYYSAARLWAELWGSSVTVNRSLSALFSLLVFPAALLLCRELFNSSLVGWMAIALLAVSPLQLLYAQQAREYSLWSALILFSGWALLRAIRLDKEQPDSHFCFWNWSLYAFLLVLGLYTFVFTGLVAIAHEIYVLAVEKRWTKTVFAFSLALLVALLLFSPWLFIVITNAGNIENTMSWASMPIDWQLFVQRWVINISNNFVDFGFPVAHPFNSFVPLILLVLAGFSLYWLVRRTSMRVWLFILGLIGVTAIALIVPDLMKGGQRSLSARYVIPCFLGIQLAVAYFLCDRLTATRQLQQKLWQAITVLLILCSIGSCVAIAEAKTWWSQPIGDYDYPIAAVVNQASHPLLITNTSDINTGDIISVSYLLEPKVKLQLVIDPTIPKLSGSCREADQRNCDVFLFYPSERLRQGLEKTYGVKTEPAYEAEGIVRLWKFSKL